MRYLIERMDKGEAPLQDALREDYVRRNLSRDEVRQIVGHPEFVQAARERLEEPFRSEEFRISRSPSARSIRNGPYPKAGG